MAVMRHAMDWQAVDASAIPAELAGDILFDLGGFAMTHTAFRFVTPGGVQFHYEVGGQAICHRPDGASADEMQLFLWGTVFGAIAWLNDFIPLHASAIMQHGGAVAFTGLSGAGKSTLAAALNARGAPHICDDTLVLATAGEGVLALPDGKPAKLWGDALHLLDGAPTASIAPVPGKFFVSMPATAKQAVPLRHLVFLEDADQLSLVPVSGAEKLTLLPDAFYREFIYLARADKAAHRAMMLALAGRVQFWRLRRPRNDAMTIQEIDKIAALITALPA